ncbi:MAG: hypothetical protein HY040_17270 [Planctomycetes bacterium]|nr:hypothetical protein [Planctomycetota bacterium]
MSRLVSYLPGIIVAGAILLIVAGCSTHPVIDVMDYAFPGRVEKGKTQPYGGVCIPQGPVQPPGPAVPVIVPAVPSVAVPVVPPPAPLPGTGGTTSPPSFPRF